MFEMTTIPSEDKGSEYVDVHNTCTTDVNEAKVFLDNASNTELVISFRNGHHEAVNICEDSEDDEGSALTSSKCSFCSGLQHRIALLLKKVESFINNNKCLMKRLFVALVTLLAIVYVIWAIVVSINNKCQDIRPLIGFVVAVTLIIAVHFIRTCCNKRIELLWKTISAHVQDNVRNKIKTLVLFGCVAVVVIVIALITWDQPSNLMSLAGFAFFVIFLWLFSAHHCQVKWRPVLCGFCLQFCFALIILRWDFGYRVFHWLGQRIQEFLSFADVGSEFVFGEKYKDHIFVMKVLPVVVFFSCVINILYYIGAMEAIISKLGWLLKVVVGTTAPESLCAAANIFIGQTEAPIMIRPYLPLMTDSELNAMMTVGFATISGAVMAAYISFGVPPEHLLCASVMNAPCALAVAKILYPETEISRIRKLSKVEIVKRKEQNILEAAAVGASDSIKLVANITVNIIAFLAMLAFINAMLSWIGGFVCHPELSFQMICSYVFMPFAFLMGVDWADAGVVGELVGIKTFLNEFLAYKSLSQYMTNRLNCTGIFLSERSEIIATYSLCGFSNFTFLAIQLGVLGPMAPEKRGVLARVIMRSLLGGIVTCLMTASVAGLLLTDRHSRICPLANTTFVSNVTMETVIERFGVVNDSVMYDRE